MRRLLALPFLAGALLWAQPALAANPPVRPALPNTLSSAHFTVHFDSDPANHDYATQTQAGDLAALAERALAAETSWGYQAPLGGPYDIYVFDATSWPGLLGVAIPDLNAAPSTGSIDIAKTVLGAANEQHVIAHELFHLIQFRTWVATAASDLWAFEGSAEWAGFKVDGYASVGTLGPPDISLDCRAAVSGQQACNSDAYIDGGYSRWPFFEYLAERYGTTFMNDVLARGALGATATNALAAAISAKGGSLGDTFSDWVGRQLAGGYGITTLDGATPTTFTHITTGATTGDLAAQKISVDHLAARFVELDRGDGTSNQCFAAQLTISVALPAGLGSRPSFYWNGTGSTPQPLAVNGNAASITVPWDTCTWSSNHALLSLPNPSLTTNSADFVVSTHLAVDTSTPAGAFAPPAPVSVPGTVVSVPTLDVAPEIDVFGPELITVSKKTRMIRVIVESSGPGALNAALGTIALGSGTLRPGNNDLRFRVPKSVLASFARGAASNILTLTPTSSAGTATGSPVKRVVRFAKP